MMQAAVPSSPGKSRNPPLSTVKLRAGGDFKGLNLQSSKVRDVIFGHVYTEKGPCYTT